MSSVIQLLCLAVLAVAYVQSAVSPEQKLGLHLLKDQDHRWRPVLKGSDVVKVTVIPAIVGVVEYEDDENTLALHMYLLMMWNNPFMKWNPADHDGLKQIVMPAQDVWVPDIDHYTNAENRETEIGDSEYSVLMTNDGGSLLIENQVYRSHNCSDHKDQVHCQFTFAEQLDVEAGDPMTKYMSPNEDYKLESVTFERKNMQYPEMEQVPKNYPQLQLKIHLSEDSDDSSEQSSSNEKDEL